LYKLTCNKLTNTLIINYANTGIIPEYFAIDLGRLAPAASEVAGGHTIPFYNWQTMPFYPRWYVRTTRVYVLLCCCCCCSSCCSCGHNNQITAFSSNFTMLSAYCTIACSLALQRCSLACSLVRQPFPVAMSGSLIRQSYVAALSGSLARQPCPATLQRSYKLFLRP
jgi:hypothetical protein